MSLPELLISMVIFIVAAAMIFTAAYGFYKSLTSYKTFEAKEIAYSNMVNVAVALANKKIPSFEGVQITETTIDGVSFYIVSTDDASIVVYKW
jgi:type II secretory pathway pseudopilin PulG